MGDGFLVEFASVVTAVDCAVAWQAAVPGRADGLSFRIGINLGDVVVQADDIYGDGVNIAARLEALAEAGGIALSEDAYRQVRGKLELSFKDLGEQSLKNISQPLRVFHLASGLAAPTSTDLASGIGIEIVRPEIPSIAVLPFDNLSGDSGQDHIGDGMAEEIITALSRVPDLFVIARNSTFVYRGRAVDPRTVGRALGVAHVVEGSLRKAGRRLRITAQLIEAESSKQLWAERYDGDIGDIFAFQDEIARKVATALQRELVHGDSLSTMQDGTRNFPAWELAMKGLAAHLQFSQGANSDARRLLEEAVALDPEYDGAWALLGWAHFIAARFGFRRDPAASLAQLRDIVARLLARDGENCDALTLSAALLILQREHEAAIAACLRALAIRPNDTTNLAFLALVYGFAGEPEKALPRIRQAMRLSPYYPAWFLGPLVEAQVQLGHLEEALALTRLFVERMPETPMIHARLAGLLGALGHAEEGRGVLARVLELAPGFTISAFLTAMYYADDSAGAKICEGLRALGLPD